MILKIAVSGVIAYALGSISPTYFVLRLSRRDGGQKLRGWSAGVRTVYRDAGATAAIAVTFLDIIKGAGATAVALQIFGIPTSFVFVPVACSLLGDVFPFYLGFRGGRAVISATGIYVYFCITAVAAGNYAFLPLVSVIVVIAIAIYVTRDENLTSVIGSFFLASFTLQEMGVDAIGILCFLIAVVVFSIGLYGAISQRCFVFGRDVDTRHWRIIARPFALLFIPIDIYSGRKSLLFLMGIISLVFIVTDIVRFATKVSLPMVFKRGEGRRFSSMTSFLVSNFISFLVFSDGIPYFALTFITIGDLFSKFCGVRFGRIVLFRGKTLEGSLGFLAGSYVACYLLSTLLPLRTLWVVVGPFAAAATELLSVDIDDNFSVSIVSGGILAALNYFMGL